LFFIAGAWRLHRLVGFFHCPSKGGTLSISLEVKSLGVSPKFRGYGRMKGIVYFMWSLPLNCRSFLSVSANIGLPICPPPARLRTRSSSSGARVGVRSTEYDANRCSPPRCIGQGLADSTAIPSAVVVAAFRSVEVSGCFCITERFPRSYSRCAKVMADETNCHDPLDCCYHCTIQFLHGIVRIVKMLCSLSELMCPTANCPSLFARQLNNGVLIGVISAGIIKWGEYFCNPYIRPCGVVRPVCFYTLRQAGMESGIITSV